MTGTAATQQGGRWLSYRGAGCENSKESLPAQEAAATLEVVSGLAPANFSLGSVGHPAFSALVQSS